MTRMALPNFLGDAIRQKREALNLSQPEAAILTKTAEKSLSKIENGKRIPSDGKLWDLAEGLGAPYPTWKLLKKRTVEAREAFVSPRRKYPKVA